MFSTGLFANENIASTIARNILAGELNPVLRVLCYVPSNKFRRICHLRHRAQYFNLSAFCRQHYVQQTLRTTIFSRATSFCNIVRNKFYGVSTLHNIENNELYHLASFCHIAQQIISRLSFATVASCLLAMIASNSLQCVFCIFTRNKYYRLSCFGNVQPPAILISHQEPLKF